MGKTNYYQTEAVNDNHFVVDEDQQNVVNKNAGERVWLSILATLQTTGELHEGRSLFWKY